MHWSTSSAITAYPSIADLSNGGTSIKTIISEPIPLNFHLLDLLLLFQLYFRIFQLFHVFFVRLRCLDDTWIHRGDFYYKKLLIHFCIIIIIIINRFLYFHLQLFFLKFLSLNNKKYYMNQFQGYSKFKF